MIDRMESSLRALERPALPHSLTPSVLARVQQAEQKRRAAGTHAKANVRRGRDRRNRLVLVAMCAGAVLGFGAQLYRLFTGELSLNFAPGLDSPFTFGEIPPPTPALLVVIIGLLLILSGLRAPLRE